MKSIVEVINNTVVESTDDRQFVIIDTEKQTALFKPISEVVNYTNSNYNDLGFDIRHVRASDVGKCLSGKNGVFIVRIK